MTAVAAPAWLAKSQEKFDAMLGQPLVRATLLELVEASAKIAHLLAGPRAVNPPAATGRYESFLGDETAAERALFEEYDARIARHAAALGDTELRAAIVALRDLDVTAGIGSITREAFRRLWACDSDDARREQVDMKGDGFKSEFVSAAFARDTAWALAQPTTNEQVD